MTQTLIPFRETKRPHKLHEGPYYGYALRKLNNPDEPSLVERIAVYYQAHPSFSVVLFIFGIFVAAFTLAAWIVR